MANNKFQIKRTSTSGVTPNTTNASNTAYISPGELAVNMADSKLFTANTTGGLLELGSNLTSLTVTTNIIANNIGVGTTPTYGVDVTKSVGSKLLRVKDTDSTYDGIILSADINGGYVGNKDISIGIGESIYFQNVTNALRFFTNGTEKARLISTGNFGIGNAAPAYTLHAQGTGYATTDFRAPVFYDSENTAYYTNPATTSVVNTVNITTITANGTTGAPGQGLVSNGTAIYWADNPGYTGSQGTTGFTGSQGAQGATGLQGTTGFTGSVGPAGPQGALGPQGPIGFTGSQGAQGPQGTTGFTGSQGATGPTGPQGPIGFTGSQGPQGTTGFTGSQGATGPQGPIGFTGSRGFTGSVGAQGPQGPIGFTGSQGATGPQGPIGFTGSQGPTGPQGPIGFTGSQGAQGPQGPTGPQGPIGFTGSRGFTGSQGAVGPTGPTGPQGPIGYTGSIGFTGSQGVGFTGSQGTTGFTGSQGVQGPIGYTGSSATGGASVTTDTTPPVSPSDGDLWWNSTDGILYVYYVDTDGGQWVQASPSQRGYTGSAGTGSGGITTGKAIAMAMIFGG